jgi:hypothetical protein
MSWKSKKQRSTPYLDMLLKLQLDTNSKLTTQLYDKQDDLNFSIVDFPDFQFHLYIVFISRSWFDRQDPCSTNVQFLIQGSLLTNKLMSQGLIQSRLQAAFRKFYGLYNYLVWKYNVNLSFLWDKCCLVCFTSI